jgi:hypothetical protein
MGTGSKKTLGVVSQKHVQNLHLPVRDTSGKQQHGASTNSSTWAVGWGAAKDVLTDPWCWGRPDDEVWTYLSYTAPHHAKMVLHAVVPWPQPQCAGCAGVTQLQWSCKILGPARLQNNKLLAILV